MYNLHSLQGAKWWSRNKFIQPSQWFRPRVTGNNLGLFPKTFTLEWTQVWESLLGTWYKGQQLAFVQSSWDPSESWLGEVRYTYTHTHTHTLELHLLEQRPIGGRNDRSWRPQHSKIVTCPWSGCIHPCNVCTLTTCVYLCLWLAKSTSIDVPTIITDCIRQFMLYNVELWMRVVLMGYLMSITYHLVERKWYSTLTIILLVVHAGALYIWHSMQFHRLNVDINSLECV